MTKEDKKKILTWKLKQLPNASELADLVEQKILTPEEARDIVVSEHERGDDNEMIKAQEETIKFLQQLVKDLTAKINGQNITYVPHYREIRIPRWYESTPVWINTTRILSASGITLSNSSDGTATVYNVGASSPSLTA